MRAQLAYSPAYDNIDVRCGIAINQQHVGPGTFLKDSELGFFTRLALTFRVNSSQLLDVAIFSTSAQAKRPGGVKIPL
jgi:hypothetical protein